MRKPLATAELIAGKLIRETPFTYRLEVPRAHAVFDRMHFVDFGRSLGTGRPAMAYAWTRLTAAAEQRMTIQVEHSDACAIWLNGREVYALAGDRKLTLRRDERSLELTHEFAVTLQPGPNTLLVRSETTGGEWRVYLQPPSAKGAVVNGASHPAIGLQGVPQVDEKITTLTNWLLLGPFPRAYAELDALLPARQHFVFGKMHAGLDGPVTWTIPKVEVLGNLIDPRPWGTNYHWNYHNGGTAWAMQQLAEATGNQSYWDYASRFCDFHLEGIPFVEHQVKTLNAVESANHWIIDAPLLDFTLAPSLPFLHRLQKERDFPKRALYEHWIARMLGYARTEQIRLPGSGIFTRTTPVKYTTWTDDMFMGIPFLMHAADYVADDRLRQSFLDDAASQTVAFNSQVWDASAGLYMHARYADRPVKLPHWSRCNGWAIWAMSEVLLQLPVAHPKRPEILAQFQALAASLAKLQADDGFWFNVLDRPDSPKEVSGTAIFVMALARGLRHGWLTEKTYRSVAVKGWHALDSRIEADGTVHDICAGTMCTEDEEYYVRRPFYDDDTHGLFAVLFAAIEMDRLMKNNHRSSGQNGANSEISQPSPAEPYSPARAAVNLVKP